MHDYQLALVLTSPLHAYSTLKFFQGFYGASDNKKLETWSFLLYWLIDVTSFYFTRVPIINLLITITCFFALSFNYVTTTQRRIINTFYIYAILLLIELFVAVALGNTIISAIEGGTHDNVIELYLVRFITLLVGYAFYRRKKETINEDLLVPKTYYFAIFSVLVGTLYLFIAPFLGEKFTSWHVIIGGGILIFICFIVVILDEKMYDIMRVYVERSALKQLSFAYENQAEIMAQSRNSLDLIKHDIKNHMLVLHSLNSSGRGAEIGPYLDTIIGELDGGVISNSNHYVIDSILNFKLYNINKSDITVDVDVNVPEKLSILPYDLTAIIGNLIDNAITATKNTKNGVINLEVSYKKGNLLIFLENSFDGKLRFVDRKLMSTKLNGNRSGLGLESIERIVKKYDGQIDIDYTEHIFSTSIILAAEE